MKILPLFLASLLFATPVFAEVEAVAADKNGDEIEATMSFQRGGPVEGNKPVNEGEVVQEEDEDYLEEQVGVYTHVQDPLTGYNHVMFEFNNVLYQGVLEPVAEGYAAVLPHDFRVGVSNFFDNLAMPMHFLSSYLQGDEEKTVRVLKRFVINTTVGMLGFGDVAEYNFNLPKVHEDMEQALLKDSKDPGPYIVWPVIGPSTATGTVGKVMDAFLNPSFWLVGDFWSGTAITGENLVNELSFNPDVRRKIQEGSLDPYLATQDTYLQYRENLLKK